MSSLKLQKDHCGLSGYDSAFEGESPPRTLIKRKLEDIDIPIKKKETSINVKKGKDIIDFEKGIRPPFLALNAYEKHKSLINQYFLYHPGATTFLQRDSAGDKRDIDVICENHQFLWESSNPPTTWEKQLAKKYYDKLYKEYCICDLSRYKESKIGMRWRTKNEVISGKGQFVCGSKHCNNADGLRTWEMNFAYLEDKEKKNALVKLRLCHDCSYCVNYRKKRKEVTQSKSKPQRQRVCVNVESGETSNAGLESSNDTADVTSNQVDDSSVWKSNFSVAEEKSREEEFESYLQDLFL